MSRLSINEAGMEDFWNLRDEDPEFDIDVEEEEGLPTPKMDFSKYPAKKPEHKPHKYFDDPGNISPSGRVVDKTGLKNLAAAISGPEKKEKESFLQRMFKKRGEEPKKSAPEEKPEAEAKPEKKSKPELSDDRFSFEGWCKEVAESPGGANVQNFLQSAMMAFKSQMAPRVFARTMAKSNFRESVMIHLIEGASVRDGSQQIKYDLPGGGYISIVPSPNYEGEWEMMYVPMVNGKLDFSGHTEKERFEYPKTFSNRQMPQMKKEVEDLIRKHGAASDQVIDVEAQQVGGKPELPPAQGLKESYEMNYFDKVKMLNELVVLRREKMHLNEVAGGGWGTDPDRVQAPPGGFPAPPNDGKVNPNAGVGGQSQGEMCSVCNSPNQAGSPQCMKCGNRLQAGGGTTQQQSWDSWNKANTQPMTTTPMREESIPGEGASSRTGMSENVWARLAEEFSQDANTSSNRKRSADMSEGLDSYYKMAGLLKENDGKPCQRCGHGTADNDGLCGTCYRALHGKNK